MGHQTANSKRTFPNYLTWLGIALAIFSIMAGWFVPEFYDWTGADQSRPAPIIGWVALAIVAVDILLMALLIWSHFAAPPKDRPTNGSGQFNIRQLISAITIVALLLMIGRTPFPMAVACFVFACVAVTAFWIAIRQQQARWSIALIVWLQFAPQIWILRGENTMQGGWSTILAFVALPTFFPTGLLMARFQMHFGTSQWPCVLTTSVALAIGVWIGCLGPKRAIAYGLVVATCSIFGSFILNALVRM